LQRIVEICGLDLYDAEARLALQLALKIHRLS
jgi:DNA-binding PucR family transcriptional regulator